MRRYILVRALQAVLSLFLLSIIIFVVVRLTGDPLTLLLSEEATEEDRLALEAALVLNQIRIGRDRGDGVCVWRLGQ